jgi:hypothetical protein
MFHNINLAVFGVVAFFFVCGVALSIIPVVQKWRNARLALAALPLAPGDVSSVPTENTSPSSDGAKSVARNGGPVSREQRATDRDVRACTGLCLYCDKLARRPLPRIMLLRSAFDWLYRHLNVVPMNRWKVVVSAPMTAETEEWPSRVCPDHADIARSHLERHVANTQVDYARFVEEQRDELLEFTEYGMDERMLADANRIRRGKPYKRAEAGPNNVRVLGTAKKVNEG